MTLASLFTNANAATRAINNLDTNPDRTTTFVSSARLDSVIASMTNPNYSLAAKTAIYNIDARSFIGIIRTNTRSYNVGKFNFLDGIGLSRHAVTTTPATTTTDTESYAMLLSGLGMMAFIARRRRHL